MVSVENNYIRLKRSELALFGVEPSVGAILGISSM